MVFFGGLKSCACVVQTLGARRSGLGTERGLLGAFYWAQMMIFDV